MQREIKNKVLIVAIFFVIFLGSTYGLFLLNKAQPSGLLLSMTLFFAFMTSCALYYMIQMIMETRKIKGPFYNLQESRGDSHILDFANRLQKRLYGLRYIVQTNDDGFRVIEDLDESQVLSLERGRKVYTQGATFFKTINPNKFKEITTEFIYEKVGDEILEKQRLLGGKKIFFTSRTEIKRDSDGKIDIKSTGLRNRDILQEVLFESRREDGWKTSLDAESKFALIMAIIGGVGGLITAIYHLFNWIFG